jgi:DNA-binding NarL/FixJ family response regulator
MHTCLRHDCPAAPPRRSVFLLLANALDCEALTRWTLSRVACDLCESSAVLADGFERCETLRPRLLVVDPALDNDAIARGIAAQHARIVHHVLVLDSRPYEGRVVDILGEPKVSYVTRAAGPAVLAKAIDAALTFGERTIDPALQDRLRATSAGFELQQAPGAPTIAGLSPRERQVMRMLALGRTVRDCAKELQLAACTVDNHKSRLMRKLGIHKTSELTCQAIRDGLISL